MYHATGLGAPIRYTTDVCYWCKQPFERPLDTRYHRVTYDGGKHGTAYFCRWSCMDKFDQQREAIEKEKAERRREAARAQAEKRRRENPPLPRPQKMHSHANPRNELDRQMRIEFVKQKIEAYSLIAAKAPTAQERKNAKDCLRKWVKKLADLKKMKIA